jgi:hypothetical protein
MINHVESDAFSALRFVCVTIQSVTSLYLHWCMQAAFINNDRTKQSAQQTCSFIFVGIIVILVHKQTVFCEERI